MAGHVGVQMKAFNWPLRRAREAKGMSVRAVADAARVSYHTMLDYENLKRWPTEDHLLAIAIALETPEDDLFPEDLQRVTGLGPTRIEFSTTPERLATLAGGVQDVASLDMEFGEDMRRAIAAAKLTTRERTILAMRFVRNLTYDEAGAEFGVTRERMRQIEAKALRKLRLTRANQHLIDYVPAVRDARDAKLREKAKAEAAKALEVDR